MRKTFDDIIRRRWEEQQFPVDQQHRERMLELLEGKKKRRAFGFWWWGAGAVVLVAGYFLLQATALEKSSTADNTHSAIAPVTIQQPLDADNNSTGNMTDNAPGKTAQPGNTFTDTDQSAAPEMSASKKKVEDQTITSTPSFNTATNDAAPGSTSNTTRKTNSKKESDPSKEKVAPVTRPDAKPGITQVISNSDEPVVAHPETVVTKTAVSHDVTDAQQLQNAKAAEAPENIEKPIEPAPDRRSIVDIAWLDALPVEPLPVDSDHGVGPIKPVKRTVHPVFAFGEAGAGLILGSLPDYPGGWKINAGAGLGYVLQPKLYLSLSGGYLLQDGGFDFQRTSTATSQSFGLRSQVNSLEPDKLHYVYGKVGLTYRMKKHILSASVGLQYLYGAQGYISTHIVDQVLPESETSRYAWLNLNGFDRFQYNAGIQYGYRLTPRFSLCAGAQYYFNELIAVDPELQANGYNWKGKTASVQPFITFNYLLYGPF